MKAKMTVIAMQVLLLTACGGGGGDSDSGAGSAPTDSASAEKKLKISCKGTPSNIVNGTSAGTALKAKFTISPSASGTGKLYKTCNGVIESTQSVVVTNGKFTGTGTMPANCDGTSTYAIVLGLGDEVGSCGWSQTGLQIELPPVNQFPNLPTNTIVVPGV